MAYNRAMMRMIKEKTAQQTDDWSVSGKTKFHSSDDAIKCGDAPYSSSKNCFRRSGVRMISSGDISLNLKTSYVP